MGVKEDISINRIYIAVSEKTGRYKLTEDDHVSIFFSEDEAEKYASEHENVRKEGPRSTDFETICRIGRQAGAEKVDIYASGVKTEESIPEMKKEHLNPKLNRALAHLKETGKKRYLLQLLDCVFYVPCRIDDQKDIMYGVAKTADTTYALAFTDLDEFWNWSGGMTWDPLEVTYHELLRVANRREIVLNVSGNRYVLTSTKLEKIREYERQKIEAEKAEAEKAEAEKEKPEKPEDEKKE